LVCFISGLVPRINNLVVCWLLFLDLAQTAFSSHFAFGALVSSWRDPGVFVQLPWSSCSIPVLTGLSEKVPLAERLFLQPCSLGQCPDILCLVRLFPPRVPDLLSMLKLVGQADLRS
jgi:hypothetical protein